MNYTNEVKEMCSVKVGASHGCAPIPQEGKWTYYSISTEGSSYAGELLKKLTTINTDKYFKEYKCNI